MSRRRSIRWPPARHALEGKAQADRRSHSCAAEFPQAFGKARVRAYGFPGIRQTRWIAGRQQLTADDVRDGTQFDDAIARTAWPIELHDAPEGMSGSRSAIDHVHYVPLGSLISPDADNLVAAGRCIDGDRRGALERARHGAVHRHGRGRRARARSRRQRQRAPDRHDGLASATIGQSRTHPLIRTE